MNWQTITILLVIFIGYLILKSMVDTGIRRFGQSHGVAFRRISYVGGTLSIMMFFLMVVAMSMVIGVNFRDIGVLMSSIFAVLGIALFAQWSILSNLTASVIIFFFFPYRVGDLVKVLDGENSVEGRIEEINLFHILLIDSESKKVTFPNSMAFQKAIIVISESKGGKDE